MKKIINIGLLTIILILVISINIKVDVKAEDNPEKGDLRCPSNGGNSCREIRDSDGTVTEVQVSTTQSGVTITKYVRRTEIVGQYEVQFGVRGSRRVSSSKNAYVMLILDASSTMKNYYSSQVIPAAKKFGQILTSDNRGHIYISFVAFNNKVSASRDFSIQNFDNANFGSWANGSEIHYGFNQANKYFAGKNGKKYVVIMGDGKYHDGDDARGSDWITLRDSTDVRYAIDYAAIGNSTTEYRNNMKFYVKEPGRYCFTGWFDSYTELFQTIAEEIYGDIQETCISGTVRDRLGRRFSLSDGSTSYTFDSISSQEVYSTPFYISIDRSAENGWYPTNRGFSFILGEDTVIRTDINPEVYWEQEEKYFDSCSDKIDWTESDEKNYPYYSVTCEQGYGNGRNKIGYQATLTVNGLPLDERRLSIGYGMGFPVNLELKNNIRCTYEFKYNEYNNRLNEINTQLRTLSEDSKLRAELEKERKEMRTTLKTYKNLTENQSRLKEEKDHFENQEATLQVKDSVNNKIKEAHLINDSILNSDINCLSRGEQTVDGQTIYTSYRCTASFHKTMKLPNACLDMQTGLQNDCASSSRTLVSGGNNFYPDLDTRKGYISLTVPRAGYFKNDIKLDGEKRDKIDGKENPRCEFDMGDGTSSINQLVVYRQIDVADPFIKNYSASRKVGSNWLNNKSNGYKYDFRNVIDKNTWSNNFQFKYTLSKVNIENIKKTTISSSERVNSYLGNDCYFKNDNKYICPFIREKDNLGNNGLFTKVEING